MSRLRFRCADGKYIDVLHKMYYVYSPGTDTVRYAICTYGPMSFEFKGKSVVVDSISGVTEELTSSADNDILSNRERQVLTLIDSGMKSTDIAEALNISVHTVSRHRQEILAKMQVKNSIEACRLARSMSLIKPVQ